MQLTEILTHTPWWVWVLLVYLVYCGVRLLSPNEISPHGMLLMPCIFLLWGVYGIFHKYSMPWTALLIFTGASLVGLFFGAVIAMRWRPVTFNKMTGMIQRPGSAMPLILILINFSCLYVLNVYAGYHPDSFTKMKFVAIYCIISGVANGLFWGMTVANLMKVQSDSTERFAG